MTTDVQAIDEDARDREIAQLLHTATKESLTFITQAIRRQHTMDDAGNRVLLAASSSTVSTWSRTKATESARQQTELVRAKLLADEVGGKASDYLKDVPKPKGLKPGGG